ncbi:hypothetical protein LY76DRAFT_649075 [Colletotrichum caudatum]|nr:hypothetical protein LY76DRAFT_649075 [Colletotrichum caudatum]
MTRSNFYATATQDTFHGVKIARGMRITISSHEDIAIRAHIVKHQLTNASPDLRLGELHQAIGIADLGQKYIDVIYPKIANAVKSRIECIANQHVYNEMLHGVADGDGTRYYPRFLDGWTKPTWQGDRRRPVAEDDDGGDARPVQRHEHAVEHVCAAVEEPDATPPPPTPHTPPRGLLPSPIPYPPPSSVGRQDGSGLPSHAPGHATPHLPVQHDRGAELRPGSNNITPPIRGILPSQQHPLGSRLSWTPPRQRRAGGQDVRQQTIPPSSRPTPSGRLLPTPPATILRPLRHQMVPPLNDRRQPSSPSPQPQANNLLSSYRTMLDELAELHLQLRQVQGDMAVALCRGRSYNGRTWMRAELRRLYDEAGRLRRRAVPLQTKLGVASRALAEGMPGGGGAAQGGCHSLGAVVELLLVGLRQ